MALTKSLSAELAPYNVLVNSLHVGRIDSNQWVVRHANSGDNKSYEEFLSDAGKALPMGRLGTADEFAGIACLLASNVGGYITGTAINVDGGLCPVV